MLVAEVIHRGGGRYYYGVLVTRKNYYRRGPFQTVSDGAESTRS